MSRITVGGGGSVQNMVSSSGLRRWWGTLGDARYGVASIAVVGDSVALGAYSNNSAGTYLLADETTFEQRGWAGQLRQMFAAAYGDPGPGMLTPADKRVTYAGGASLFTTALTVHGLGTQLASGGASTVTYSLPACTAFDILLWTPSGAGGASTYTIDGGSAQAIAASPATANTAYKASATGLSNATHTVVVNAPPSGGTLFVYGINAKLGTTGVQVHRLGKSGAKTTDALNIGATDSFSGSGPVPDRTYLNTFGPNGSNASLVIVSLGTNDAATPQTLTPTQYAANLQSFITWAVAQGKCVLLLTEPRRAVPNGLTYTEQAYYDAASALATSNDHVAFLDMQPIFGTYAQATATDQALMADTIHPNRKGHGVIADTLYRELTTPPRY